MTERMIMELISSCVLSMLAILNIVTFSVYGIDKNRAIEGTWRIPEKVLLMLAAVGGSIGAYLGMRFFHHKTLKPRFSVGIPLMIIAQAIIIYCLRVML